MNWDAIGAVGEILGAQVFISLLVVAAQIKRNTNQARALMSSNITAEQSRIGESISRDSELAAILLKVMGGEELEPLEQLRWGFHIDRSFYVWCGIQAAHDNGQLDDEFFNDCEQTIRNFSALTGVKELLKFNLAMNHPRISQDGVFRAVFENDDS